MAQGTTSATTSPPSAVEPVYLGTGGAAVAVSAGDLHTCIVLSTGRVRCWGFGGNGRLG